MSISEKTGKTSIDQKTDAPGKDFKALSVKCRCQCSTVCIISGPDTITAGKTKTYTIDISLAKNSGCQQATSGCKHVDTAWTVGGTMRRAVTLRDKKKLSVKAKVAGGTAAGSFTLKAQPNYTCKCIGAATGAVPINCTDTANVVTIKTAA